MDEADRAWREALRAVTIADLATMVNADYGRDIMSVIGEWLPQAQ
jgi:hypothetical protein